MRLPTNDSPAKARDRLHRGRKTFLQRTQMGMTQREYGTAIGLSGKFANTLVSRYEVGKVNPGGPTRKAMRELYSEYLETHPPVRSEPKKRRRRKKA